MDYGASTIMYQVPECVDYKSMIFYLSFSLADSKQAILPRDWNKSDGNLLNKTSANTCTTWVEMEHMIVFASHPDRIEMNNDGGVEVELQRCV